MMVGIPASGKSSWIDATQIILGQESVRMLYWKKNTIMSGLRNERAEAWATSFQEYGAICCRVGMWCGMLHL